MSAGDGPTKVAVLGGGVGGMTAAFELTRPELNGRFDVTVYQLGWRLGGKGASGRNMKRGARIEEHGLHVWFGFYTEAFAMMRDVYEELDRDAGSPLAEVKDAFTPCPVIALYDYFGDVWHSHAARFPRWVDEEPWERAPQDLPGLFTVARRAVELALDSLSNMPSTQIVPPTAIDNLEQARDRAEALQDHSRDIGTEATRVGFRFIVGKAGDARDSLGEAWAEGLEGVDASMLLRLFFTSLDALVAAGVGILADGVLEEGWEAIDGEDWAAWLERHGASALTIGESPATRAPVLRAVYDVAFCYPEGNVDKANASAGAASSDLLKLLFSYRGDIAYKMTAGMGDAIFAPLYELLAGDERGVKFRFFHAVHELRPSAEGRHVDEIDVIPQVNGTEDYPPLVNVKGLPCWPNLPRWEHLPREAEAVGTRFETELDPLDRKEHKVSLKRGEDFDEVVLAIPVGALPLSCEPLMKKDPQLRLMVDQSATVRTEAFQLWTRRSSEELGFPHPADSVAATFVEPLDTYCDMAHLLPRESWDPDDDVHGVAYVCGVLDESSETQEEANEQVRQNALGYVGHDLPSLWRNAGDDPWSELSDPEGREGEERFQAQYWRANIAPWERYVITPAGTVQSRLPSYGASCENLALAGDWTANGLNGGCVEAAVISGKEAARAIIQGGPSEEQQPAIGSDPRWLTHW